MENKLKINAVIGIDPGANGGIAIFVPGKNVQVSKMPKELKKMSEFLQYYRENFHPIVFLEKLSVRPDDIRADSSGVNMGKLFRIQKMIGNYEHLKALIEGAEIPYIMVHPLKWQSALKLRLKGVKEEKKERKKRYQEYAKSLYPEVNVTLWNSDALLLMHFGRFVLVNEQKWVKANLPEREYQKLF